MRDACTQCTCNVSERRSWAQMKAKLQFFFVTLDVVCPRTSRIEDSIVVIRKEPKMEDR